MPQHPLDGEMVLPVLVGPRTAVTPAHGAGVARRRRRKRKRHQISRVEWPGSSAGTPFCITMRRRKSAALSKRTSLERIAPESILARCTASFTPTCRPFTLTNHNIGYRNAARPAENAIHSLARLRDR